MTTDEIDHDIREYIHYSRTFAEQLLTENGEFSPFASQTDTSGRFCGVGFDDINDRPSGQILLDSMTDHFESELFKNTIRSFCIAFDARVKNATFPGSTDAIIISIRYNDAILKWFYPYSIEPGNKIEYLDAWSEKGKIPADNNKL